MVGGHGKGVAALVFRVAGVALYPVESHAVPAVDGVEPEPQVHVLFLLEAGSLPLLQPAFVEGLNHVG